MSQRYYIVGNWKMNGMRAALSEARAIDRAAQRLPKVEVALAPPVTLIAAMRESLNGIGVGAQNCHHAEKGAHTGDLAASMLREGGADFVIVGHSERRADHNETNEMVKAKAEAAQGVDMGVILCVGESEAERDSGEAEEIVARQLAASLPDNAQRLSVAYEPIWAIGTGRVPQTGDVAKMHRRLREVLVEKYGDEEGAEVRILYGGSVKGENAAELLAVPEVGGALVGGASLTADGFVPIVVAASEQD
ncbi:triose-phosphate isomerase [Croceicoccus naphthovorans]|uniref:Triosephosphate isomerase n=1 Tax=Croceicoccus naphthovorans TaxID=1348774 RepID=A0A0G3XFI3_9SPHN|nr:triose-phosphate isomerase [Croceicoccus naphthovorans]AKM09967.1 triosephosphate isomerase [Croceicoccus naphthovorans]MBB3990866.1 triosephosphate isomerase [Croceicoccus naphthovorans]